MKELMKESVIILDHGVTSFAIFLSACCLGVAVSLAFYQVITRFILMDPSTWSEALTRIMLIWMVYAGMAGAFRHGTLITMDLVSRRASGRMHVLLQLIAGASSIAFLGVLLWYGVELVFRVRSQVLSSLDISIAWAYAAIPVGATFSLLAIVARWLDSSTYADESALRQEAGST